MRSFYLNPRKRPEGSFRYPPEGSFRYPHISPNSPCKDKGAGGSYAGQTDIDGQNRVYNGIVDIGADEYWQ